MIEKLNGARGVRCLIIAGWDVVDLNVGACATLLGWNEWCLFHKPTLHLSLFPLLFFSSRLWDHWYEILLGMGGGILRQGF